MERWLFILICFSFLDDVAGVTFTAKIKFPRNGADLATKSHVDEVFATRRSTFLKGVGDNFIVHKPGVVAAPGTVSFESRRLPGYYLRYKNYRFHLEELRNRTDNLSKRDSTFKEVKHASLPGTELLQLFAHEKWFLCKDENGAGLNARKRANEALFLQHCSLVVKPVVKAVKKDETPKSVLISNLNSTHPSLNSTNVKLNSTAKQSNLTSITANTTDPTANMTSVKLNSTLSKSPNVMFNSTSTRSHLINATLISDNLNFNATLVKKNNTSFNHAKNSTVGNNGTLSRKQQLPLPENPTASIEADTKSIIDSGRDLLEYLPEHTQINQPILTDVKTKYKEPTTSISFLNDTNSADASVNVITHGHHLLQTNGENDKQNFLKQVVDDWKDKCINLLLTNYFGKRYRIVSDVNPTGYRPKGIQFSLKTIFKNPNAHKRVIFRAIDEYNNANALLLNGNKELIALPTVCTAEATKVEVTQKQPPTTDTVFGVKRKLGCQKVIGTTNSSNKSCCHFPFIYNNIVFTRCTGINDNKPWCALTGNFDRDKRWGYCMLPTIPMEDKNDGDHCDNECKDRDECPRKCPLRCCRHHPNSTIHL